MRRCHFFRFAAAFLLLILPAIRGSASAQSTTAGSNSATGTSQGVSEPHGRVLDTEPRVLVLAAMRSEIEPLLAAASVERIETLSGRNAYIGKLGGVDVVITAVGVSMVNAALHTQEALHHFAIRLILFSGIAGGSSPHLGVGDVTVPARWAQYQEHWFADDPEFASRARSLGNFEMMYPGPVRVTRDGGPADQTEAKLWFATDTELLQAAERALGELPKLERCNRRGQCVDTEPRVAVGGSGVSGPTFVDHAEYRDWVWETFEADVLDMETAAVGHVAYTHRVPYIAVRGISDLAGGHSGTNRMWNFTPMAARNAAAVAIAILRHLDVD